MTCEYCRADNPRPLCEVGCYDDGVAARIIRVRGRAFIEFSACEGGCPVGGTSRQISYCPMCGRDLRGDAS